MKTYKPRLDTRREVALHEAARAVIALHLNVPFVEVNIDPSSATLDARSQSEERTALMLPFLVDFLAPSEGEFKESLLHPLAFVSDYLTVLLAGRCAEELAAGSERPPELRAYDDDVIKHLASIVTNSADERDVFIAWITMTARHLVMRSEENIRVVRDALLEAGALDAEEIRDVLRPSRAYVNPYAQAAPADAGPGKQDEATGQPVDSNEPQDSSSTPPPQNCGGFGDKSCGGLPLPKEEQMSNESSYFNRLVQNDSARKGLASAIVGVLVAAVIEAWPSKS